MAKIKFPSITRKTLTDVQLSKEIQDNAKEVQSFINIAVRRREYYENNNDPNLPCITWADEGKKELSAAMNSRKQVLNLFNYLNSMLDLEAVHLFSLQKIIFNARESSYCLDYSDLSKLRIEPLHVSFNPEQGYTLYDQEIATELNKFFILWKKNGMKGEVIQADQAGFYQEDLIQLRQDARCIHQGMKDPKSQFSKLPAALAIEIAVQNRGRLSIETARKEAAAIINTKASPGSKINSEFLAEFLKKHTQQFEQDKRRYCGLFGWMRKSEISKDWTLTQLITHGLKHNNRTRQVMLSLDWLLQNDQGTIAINPEILQYNSTENRYHFDAKLSSTLSNRT